MSHHLDALDLALLHALAEHPRAGDLELSRTTGVARATVQSRLRRLADDGVLRDWSPTVEPAAAGFGVQAFVTLEIAQGALDQVTSDLAAIPQVLEAHATTGTADVLCKLAARSNDELQDVLLRLARTGAVVRSTSVMVLSTLIAPRVLELLDTSDAPPPRSPAFR